MATKDILARLQKEIRDEGDTNFSGMLPHAFQRSTRYWRSIFLKDPPGWGARSRRRLAEVIAESDAYVQALNDRYTDPSGGG